MQNLKFSILKKDDINAVVEIINKAYRGEISGKAWTSEGKILSGIRVNEDMIKEILEEKNSKIYITKFEDKIVGTIQAKLENNSIYIGLFAVNPYFQGSGVGKKLLEFTEKSSMKLYNADKFIMQVISIRTDLIEFYKRRGYKVTNSFLEFPKSELWDFRTNEELKFVVLEKDILR
ncbi:GNAT family N-acetyltransferase [Aliarcobacter cryaerophilus ATCC 43158]|nr:GNAT family N-acetyltransferase [Aliarcobacter cryaerophilus]QCZ24792.1 GNAT family N-acetyltransferase [Aliarcobacter cryaerophilus ATCC 43158]